MNANNMIERTVYYPGLFGDVDEHFHLLRDPGIPEYENFIEDFTRALMMIVDRRGQILLEENGLTHRFDLQPYDEFPFRETVFDVGQEQTEGYEDAEDVVKAVRALICARVAGA